MNIRQIVFCLELPRERSAPGSINIVREWTPITANEYRHLSADGRRYGICGRPRVAAECAFSRLLNTAFYFHALLCIHFIARRWPLIVHSAMILAKRQVNICVICVHLRIVFCYLSSVFLLSPLIFLADIKKTTPGRRLF